MFFYLSKIIGFFLLPSNFLCCLIILGLFLARTRFTLLGNQITGTALVTLLVMAFSPLGNLLILPLEQRFSRPPVTKTDPAPYGIIVLGGSIDTVVSRARGAIAINESAERLTETVSLARRFPKAHLIFTGGSGRILYQTMREADGAQKLFAKMGIPSQRIRFERKSKNTWQNAQFTKAILGSSSNRHWLLVTSAYHMPRSVGCFRKAGINVTPWPVDYRTRGNSDIYRLFNRASEGWKRVDIAVREWAGLIAYRLTGRTDSLFPA